MDKPKLTITPKKYIEETMVISSRMPKDMVRHIDEIAKKTGRTRNEIMMMSLEFALNHMEIDTDEKG